MCEGFHHTLLTQLRATLLNGMDRQHTRAQGKLQSLLSKILGKVEHVSTHSGVNSGAISTSLVACLNAAKLALSLEALGCDGVDLLAKFTQREFTEVLEVLSGASFVSLMSS